MCCDLVANDSLCVGSIGPYDHVHFTVSTLCLISRAIGIISFFVPPANVIQLFFASSNIATLHQEKGEPVKEARLRATQNTILSFWYAREFTDLSFGS